MRKQKKADKMRGGSTHGYGSKKKHRGAGSRGGKGYAGSFNHKRVYLRKYEPEHFAKKKFKSLRNRNIAPTIPSMNLRELVGKEGEFPQHKILGTGTVPKGMIVKAKAFSVRAKEKIEAAGGQAIEV